MHKFETIEDLRRQADRLSIGKINEILRPIGVRIGREGGEWFADFCRDHPAFEAGATGSRSYTEDKAGALDDALHSAVWYRRYVAFTDGMDLTAAA